MRIAKRVCPKVYSKTGLQITSSLLFMQTKPVLNWSALTYDPVTYERVTQLAGTGRAIAAEPQQPIRPKP